MSDQRRQAFDTLERNPAIQTGADLARIMQIPARSARRYMREFNQKRRPAVDTYVFTGKEKQLISLPVFTGFWKVSGDWLVCGDVHLPTTNFALAYDMLETARYLGIKNLAIVGDLLNMDALSKYEHIMPPVRFADEVEPAIDMLAEYSGWFDQIKMVLGNHDHRLMKSLRGDFKADWYARILDAANGKLEISPYSHMELKSGKEKWRLTHPGNYSRVKGRVADTLAQKYQCNVVTFHEHHVAKMRDTFNRYTLINGGGLFDHEKMAYVMLVDNTSPIMCNGFVVIQNGTGEIVTPYPSFTNLDYYGL